MAKILRHRTLSLLIAFIAIIAHALSPDVLAGMQGGVQAAQGLEICHAMSAVSPAQAPAHQQMTKGHACCKVCVCHPAAAAIVGGQLPPQLPPAGADVVVMPVPRAEGTGVYRSKSSPRGPPVGACPTHPSIPLRLPREKTSCIHSKLSSATLPPPSF